MIRDALNKHLKMLQLFSAFHRWWKWAVDDGELLMMVSYWWWWAIDDGELLMKVSCWWWWAIDDGELLMMVSCWWWWAVDDGEPLMMVSCWWWSAIDDDELLMGNVKRTAGACGAHGCCATDWQRRLEHSQVGWQAKISFITFPRCSLLKHYLACPGELQISLVKLINFGNAWPLPWMSWGRRPACRRCTGRPRLWRHCCAPAERVLCAPEK